MVETVQSCSELLFSENEVGVPMSKTPFGPMLADLLLVGLVAGIVSACSDCKKV